MSTPNSGYGNKSKVNNYVARALSRIIVPKGSQQVTISVGEDSIQVTSEEKNNSDKKAGDNNHENNPS